MLHFRCELGFEEYVKIVFIVHLLLQAESQINLLARHIFSHFFFIVIIFFSLFDLKHFCEAFEIVFYHEVLTPLQMHGILTFLMVYFFDFLDI